MWKSVESQDGYPGDEVPTGSVSEDHVGPVRVVLVPGEIGSVVFQFDPQETPVRKFSKNVGEVAGNRNDVVYAEQPVVRPKPVLEFRLRCHPKIASESQASEGLQSF
jgi:hypothetical protein